MADVTGRGDELPVLRTILEAELFIGTPMLAGYTAHKLLNKEAPSKPDDGRPASSQAPASGTRRPPPGGLWSLYIYVFKKDKYFPNPGDAPSWEDVLAQMRVSVAACVWYSLMPVFGEWLIERGWTHTYSTFDEVGGLPQYLAWLFVYMAFVEWGIYWVHRLLHHPLIYPLHRPHHIYNNKNSLSPFAGLAFDPLDGMLQASPYLVGLFIVPVHFWTHEILLFCTGIWTANIHDSLPDWELGLKLGVMGSSHHTAHHVFYNFNFGQYTAFWDWVHDTLAPPKAGNQRYAWDTPARIVNARKKQ